MPPRRRSRSRSRERVRDSVVLQHFKKVRGERRGGRIWRRRFKSAALRLLEFLVISFDALIAACDPLKTHFDHSGCQTSSRYLRPCRRYQGESVYYIYSDKGGTIASGDWGRRSGFSGGGFCEPHFVGFWGRRRATRRSHLNLQFHLGERDHNVLLQCHLGERDHSVRQNLLFPRDQFFSRRRRSELQRQGQFFFRRDQRWFLHLVHQFVFQDHRHVLILRSQFLIHWKNLGLKSSHFRDSSSCGRPWWALIGIKLVTAFESQVWQSVRSDIRFCQGCVKPFKGWETHFRVASSFSWVIVVPNGSETGCWALQICLTILSA